MALSAACTCMLSLVAACVLSSCTASAPPPQRWVGTYHGATGNVADGKNTSAFDVG